MESYKVIDDRSGAVLLDTTGKNFNLNVWDFAEEQIKSHPEYDVFIEVYENGRFEHWVDSESILHDNMLSREGKI